MSEPERLRVSPVQGSEQHVSPTMVTVINPTNNAERATEQVATTRIPKEKKIMTTNRDLEEEEKDPTKDRFNRKEILILVISIAFGIALLVCVGVSVHSTMRVADLMASLGGSSGSPLGSAFLGSGVGSDGNLTVNYDLNFNSLTGLVATVFGGINELMNSTESRCPQVCPTCPECVADQWSGAGSNATTQYVCAAMPHGVALLEQFVPEFNHSLLINQSDQCGLQWQASWPPTVPSRPLQVRVTVNESFACAIFWIPPPPAPAVGPMINTTTFYQLADWETAWLDSFTLQRGKTNQSFYLWVGDKVLNGSMVNRIYCDNTNLVPPSINSSLHTLYNLTKTARDSANSSISWPDSSDPIFSLLSPTRKIRNVTVGTRSQDYLTLFTNATTGKNYYLPNLQNCLETHPAQSLGCSSRDPWGCILRKVAASDWYPASEYLRSYVSSIYPDATNCSDVFEYYQSQCPLKPGGRIESRFESLLQVLAGIERYNFLDQCLFSPLATMFRAGVNLDPQAVANTVEIASYYAAADIQGAAVWMNITLTRSHDINNTSYSPQAQMSSSWWTTRYGNSANLTLGNVTAFSGGSSGSNSSAAPPLPSSLLYNSNLTGGAPALYLHAELARKTGLGLDISFGIPFVAGIVDPSAVFVVGAGTNDAPLCPRTYFISQSY